MNFKICFPCRREQKRDYLSCGTAISCELAQADKAIFSVQ